LVLLEVMARLKLVRFANKVCTYLAQVPFFFLALFSAQTQLSVAYR
jgi:hypothetical protein